MSFFKKIKQPLFWTSFTKVAIPFFIIVTIISLLIASAGDLFSGDFAKVFETNFSEGKWQNFFGFKVVFSVFYGLYLTNKKMK